ncbi:MAG TPA: zinc ribbon domain-containing protein, partial [Planctomycetota bacterium]|nr:zinc ribbon domain-containing protein [Planctomycetota bacterium]
MALDRRPLKNPAVVKKAPSKPAIPPAPPKTCTKCAAEIPAGASFCEACGTPLKAGAKPKRSLVEIRRNVEKGRNTRTIASGRNTLLWVAILNIGLGLLVYFLMADQFRTTADMDPEWVTEVQKA